MLKISTGPSPVLPNHSAVLRGSPKSLRAAGEIAARRRGIVALILVLGATIGGSVRNGVDATNSETLFMDRDGIIVAKITSAESGTVGPVQPVRAARTRR